MGRRLDWDRCSKEMRDQRHRACGAGEEYKELLHAPDVARKAAERESASRLAAPADRRRESERRSRLGILDKPALRTDELKAWILGWQRAYPSIRWHLFELGADDEMLKQWDESLKVVDDVLRAARRNLSLN